MPAIDPTWLNALIYLYTSETNAQDGAASGGAGFLASMPTVHQDWRHIYAVTNLHVLDGGCHVIRLNTTEGRTRAIRTNPDDWTISTDDDLAVVPFELGEGVDWNHIPSEIFLSEGPTNRGKCEFGPGDEAVLIGRLIAHDGRQRNMPVVRFGNIAMMADTAEPILVDGTRSQVAFLVECRSLSGFSGSPALAYLSPQRRDGWTLIGTGAQPVLLGVDCAHLPFWSPVCEQRDRRTAIKNMWVETNSGIAVVAPAWRLTALLNEPELVRQRELDDRRLAEQLHSDGPVD